MKKFSLLIVTLSLLIAGFSQAQATLAYEDPTFGQDSAPLQMEIFDDYQCPFCARFHETLMSNQILENYINSGLMQITIKDFPLTGLHKNARNAARAVNSVGVINPDILITYIDKVFRTQEEWENLSDPAELFYSYAQAIADTYGTAMGKNEFYRYYADAGNSSEITADLDKGEERGVNGTPTYFINGKMYSGASDLETLIQRIETALSTLNPTNQGKYFSVVSHLDTTTGLIKVDWEAYPHSSVKFYKIKISSSSLIDNDTPEDRAIISMPAVKHYDIFNTEYFFKAEKNRLYFITVEAYDPDSQLLDSTSTQLDPRAQRFDCPSYEPPACPNGTVIYPPAADGCPGIPYCKTNTIDMPKAGYEEEVVVRLDAVSNPFSDTDSSSMEGQAAADLYNRGVIGGFPDGEFKGDRPVNRAEAAKFLLLAKNALVPERVTANPFRDVIVDEWYAPFVVQASKLNIIFGYQDGSFRPADGVQTDEFLAMLARTFDLPTGLPNSYADQSDYPGAWFWDYAGIAQQYNLFPSRGNRLNPAQQLSRNEVAIALYQYLKNR